MPFQGACDACESLALKLTPSNSASPRPHTPSLRCQLATLDVDIAVQIPRLGQIVAFRKVLIHGYAVVNHETVWNVVQDALPELVVTLRRLLADASA